MSKQTGKRHAGETARMGGASATAGSAKRGTGKKKAVARWHYVTKDNRRILRDPDGRDWHGTRAEVREVAMSPRSRNMLACSLRCNRHIYLSGGGKPDMRNYRAAARWRRQDAIQAETTRTRESVEVSRDEYILLGACARYMERTIDEFVTECVCEGISATIDEALSDGLAELPLTRYERRAFRGRQADYCLALKIRDMKKNGTGGAGKERKA